ncbi:MAG: hypothetical protein IBX68_01530 [Dehalococcoidia bacterium]|nr:hypothetical protein [Dehalococcoidia bacterium]
MPVDTHPSDIPVLLLHNIDLNWSSAEQEETIHLAERLAIAIESVGHPVALAPVSDNDLDYALQAYDPLEHIVFNWCETVPGIPHSEWLVAWYLERAGFVFTGADSNCLALTQEKSRIKYVLETSEVPTPRWKVFDRPPPPGACAFPAIVKPVREHCSEGISRESVVITDEELGRRIEYIAQIYRQPALVEDFLDGREFHVSLWGNGRIEMLPPVEMDFSFFGDIRDRLCTYESKHIPQSAHYQNIQAHVPARLTEDEAEELERTCRAAYAAARCRDYARIDLRLQDGVFHVLDVNPNADISADASMACAAEKAGYTYGEMGSRLVRLAARRHPVWGSA